MNADIVLNLTGNARKEAEGLLKQIEDIEKSVGQSMGAGGKATARYNPQALRDALKNKKEDDLLKRKEKLQRNEERQFRNEVRKERESERKQYGIPGMLAEAPFLMNPLYAAQRTGGKLMGMAREAREVRRNRTQELIAEGKTLKQARTQAASETGAGGMPVGMLTKLGPIGIAIAAAAGLGIAAYKTTQDVRGRFMPFRGGLARDVGNLRGVGGVTNFRRMITGSMADVAGFGPEGVAMLYGNMLRRRGPGGRGMESLNYSTLRQLGIMSGAYGVGPQTTMGLQNLFMQSGMINTSRANFQSRIMSLGDKRHSANMELYLQQATQVMQDTLSATGNVVPGQAEMIARFGTRMLPQAGQIMGRMNQTMRAAAGAGTATEQFYLRAFGGDYAQAYKSMEGGMNTNRFKAVLKQLKAEGYEGFGMQLRMKQLGLFQTTEQARNVLETFDLTGKYDPAAAAKRAKNYETSQIAKLGETAKSIEAQTINAKILSVGGEAPVAAKGAAETFQKGVVEPTSRRITEAKNEMLGTTKITRDAVSITPTTKKRLGAILFGQLKGLQDEDVQQLNQAFTRYASGSRIRKIIKGSGEVNKEFQEKVNQIYMRAASREGRVEKVDTEKERQELVKNLRELIRVFSGGQKAKIELTIDQPTEQIKSKNDTMSLQPLSGYEFKIEQ